MPYLFFDHGGVLDGEVSTETPNTNDLVLQKIDEGIYQVVKNGVSFIKDLNALVAKHGAQIVFHSKNKEKDQVELLKQLISACEKKGLTFPKVTAMGVFDKDQYATFSSDNPKLIKDHPLLIQGKEYRIQMACWGKDDAHGKASLRRALEVLLNIAPEDRSKYFVFDDGPSVIDAANQEGYRGILVGNENPIAKAIQTVKIANVVQSLSSNVQPLQSSSSSPSTTVNKEGLFASDANINNTPASQVSQPTTAPSSTTTNSSNKDMVIKDIVTELAMGVLMGCVNSGHEEHATMFLKMAGSPNGVEVAVALTSHGYMPDSEVFKNSMSLFNLFNGYSNAATKSLWEKIQVGLSTQPEERKKVGQVAYKFSREVRADLEESRLKNERSSLSIQPPNSNRK